MALEPTALWYIEVARLSRVGKRCRCGAPCWPDYRVDAGHGRSIALKCVCGWEYIVWTHPYHFPLTFHGPEGVLPDRNEGLGTMPYLSTAEEILGTIWGVDPESSVRHLPR